jgi:tetratricopeptide (TPR) repeat protein
VDQSRADAQRRDEERIQARMNEVFQKRQAEQVTSLMSRAAARRAAGAYDEAIDLLSTVTTLEPGRADAAALIVACYREQGARLENARDATGAAVAFGRALALDPADSVAAAGQKRCQAESDLRSLRSTETQRLFARSLDAFGADDLGEASRGFRQVLEIEPGDRDAAAMLRRTDQAIALRVQGLLADCERSLDAGRLEDATDLLDRAAELDAQADGIAAMRASLARARSGEQVRARPTREIAAPPAAPKMSAKELDLLYRRGLTAMQEHRSDDALRFWEIVWSSRPGYGQVGENLKREYLTRGMEAFAAGRLDEAAGFWRRALHVDPNDQRALGYLQRAEKQLSRTRELLGN